MKNKDNPYSIPYKRELTSSEVKLLQYLLKDHPEHQRKISTFKVVSRCGCGECPTVLFGDTFESEPLTKGFSQIVGMSGKIENGTIVGVAVIERENKIAELEAWSVSGGEVTGWPSIEALGEQ